MVEFLPEDPVRICCGNRHAGAVCPDGKVMCAICFERVELDELYVDENKDRWDVCLNCREDEIKYMRGDKS